jgi:hypothetical protein
MGESLTLVKNVFLKEGKSIKKQRQQQQQYELLQNVAKEPICSLTIIYVPY